ncbi:hypothetical protein DFA_03016 [Cavenderia fasciculata]|uniref:COX assembly mitochondrial protein n=1 Tax=Cavenderia fasciculata TaxID=261658 RepID=F4PGD8_CACFS|nr:uncharacterized protein DFA_03016 [Cavenderia fasciculata]EGG24772.1 hypothetical protein DFA_03016 [Cavenderia fasciculata]|eukprot:XP_004362623.1 hypothetical protein DFA_03016 [Cavenderia fasciculata]
MTIGDSLNNNSNNKKTGQDNVEKDMGYMSIPDSEIIVPNAIDSYLRKKLKDQTLTDCESSVREFARCTEDKLFSVIWECKEQQQKMRECLTSHTTPERLQALKREWIDHTKQKIWELKKQHEQDLLNNNKTN